MTATTRGATTRVKCACCKTEFVARVADRKRGWAKYCSKSCKAIVQTRRTGYAGPRAERAPFQMSHADLSDGHGQWE